LSSASSTGEGGQSVDLSDVLQVIRERKWVVIFCTLAAVAIAVIVGAFSTPMYRAAAQILRQTAALDQALFDAQVYRLIDQERDLATGSDMVKLSVVAANVKKELGSTRDIESLKKMITVTPLGQTNIVEIVGTSPDSWEAADVANSFARQFIAYRKEADREGLAVARQQIEAQIASMTAEELASDSGKTLRESAQQLLVLESLQTGGYELIQEATAPVEPFSPQIVRDASIALVIGLVLGLLAAFLLNLLDKRLKDEETAQRLFGAPLIASIPRVGTRWSHLHGKRLAVAVGFRDGGDSAIEAFRTLRSNLKFFEVNKKVRTILITSALPREGKSITTINLALSLTMSGARVIVLEGDLRRPMLHSYLDVERREGFSDLLAGTRSVSQVIQVADVRPLLPSEHMVTAGPAKVSGTRAKQLSSGLPVIVAGSLPPNPAELIAMDRTGQIIQELASVSDYVLIDAPPILLVSDALELAKKVDAVVIVARLLSTTTDEARQAQEALEKIGVKPLGVVLSDVTKPRGHRRHYGEYYAKA